MRPWFRTWAGLWVACVVLWLVLDSTVVGNEVVTGVWAAGLAAGSAVLVLRHEPRVRRTGRWPASIAYLRVPGRVMRETVELCGVLIDALRGRQPESRFEEVGTSPAVEGREALATILASVSPNQYVVGFDAERRVAVVHSLVPRSHQSLDEVVGIR